MSKKEKKKASNRKKIMDAYVRLLKEKQFDRITVRELCEELDIVRSTFYAYYQSVYDLIEDIENTLLGELHLYRHRDGAKSEFMEIVDEIKNGETGSIFRLVEPMEATKNFYRNVDENKEYLRAFLGKNGDPYFRTRLAKQFERDVSVMMEDDNVPEDYFRTVFCQTSVGLFIRLTDYWLNTEENRMTLDDICRLSNVIRAGSSLLDFNAISDS